MEPKIITRSYIKNFFQIEENDEKILDSIMEALTFKEFSNNALICGIGEEADAMYFLESGTCNVLDVNKEVINEMKPGAYFGEYAALVGDKRMADIQAKGSALVYQLHKDVLLSLTRNNPKIYALFLKKVYGQSSEKYRQLLFALNSRRGVSRSPVRKVKLPELIVNYGLVFIIFLSTALFAPTGGTLSPFWLCLPIVFLVGYIITTKRTLEALTLSAMLALIITARWNFIGAFYGQLLATISDESTLEILLLIAFMGSLTRLFTASGSINALRDWAEEKLKTPKATLLTAFFCSFIISIDDYLSVLIGSSCFMPIADQKRIPREKSAIVMGTTPTAVCLLNPLSLWGIYLAGLMAMSGGSAGMFVSSIRFNFSAMLVILFSFLLAVGKIPVVGAVKRGIVRVEQGGTVVPPDTDDGTKAEDANRGRIINLILPIVVLVAASILSGILLEDSFSVNVLYGIIVCFIFTFFLYCFERYMTPEQFFEHIVFGMESMLAPIVMLIVVSCFSNSMDGIGFSDWLNITVQGALGGWAGLLPAILFALFTAIAMLFGSSWAMFAIGIPIALQLAVALNGDIGLYLGAVCAAGLSGDGLSMYNGDMFFFASVLGIKAQTYYTAKLPYVICIAVLAMAGFVVCGLLV